MIPAVASDPSWSRLLRGSALFPLIALILPAMFIVTLGPVLMEAMSFLASS